MKKIALMSILTLATLSVSGQSAEEKAIKAVISSYAKSGDENDTTQLNQVLDKNFNVIMNRLFGSTEVKVLSKEEYLQKIAAKEFGGDKRKITFQNVQLNGTTASAIVTFQGSKMTFVSIIVLVKDLDGNWKLVSEAPVVK